MASELVRCDTCEGATRQGKVGQALDDLREQLRGVGWLCRRVSGVDVDVCPECRAKN